MKKPLVALLLAIGAAGPALAQVSVSIGINQPGVYGRIHIGDAPRPALVVPEPVIVTPPSVRVERQPIYLYVPPAHQRDWHRYCGRYAACGQPVYFVQEQWVRDRYEREHPREDRGRHRGWDRGHGHGHDRDDHDRDRDDHRRGRRD